MVKEEGSDDTKGKERRKDGKSGSKKVSTE